MIAACSQQGARGAEWVRRLQLQPDDSFVLKPRHSAFHDAASQCLLYGLGVRRLVLTGIAVDRCVLATAMDVHMRGYARYVPEDCVAAESPVQRRRALALLRDLLQIDTRAAAWITRRELNAP